MSESIHNPHAMLEHELSTTPEIRHDLLSASRWAKFISIVGFIFIGFFIAIAITTMVTGERFLSRPYYHSGIMNNSSLTAAFGITNILLAVLCFFPYLFIYRFASRTKSAMLTGDEISFEHGMRNLRNLYQYSGIMMIIGLAFILLSIIAIMLGTTIL